VLALALAKKDETRLEATLLVLTSVAFSIKKFYKSLDDMSSEDASNIDEAEQITSRREDIIFEKESVIAQLPKLAVHLDYSDEMSRRKMFQLFHYALEFGMLKQVDSVSHCILTLNVLTHLNLEENVTLD
jgi:condensin complex subunit 3